jgi:hypothetical protein
MQPMHLVDMNNDFSVSECRVYHRSVKVDWQSKKWTRLLLVLVTSREVDS